MVDRISPMLTKKQTRMGDPLTVGLKLSVTLRFLASGDSYTSLQYSFRVSKSAICRFLPKVCKAIINTYKHEVLKCPKTSEEWNTVAEVFVKKWNYHNCGGALDGKHAPIKKPKKGGSLYYRHHTHGRRGCKVQVPVRRRTVGAERGAGDGGTWIKCNLHHAIEQNQVGFPEDCTLPNNDTPISFHIIADDAFALKTTLMKPYSHTSQFHHEKIYSYRLSRARRVVEKNAFGILQMRLRFFGTTIQQGPKVVKLLTMCGCVLYNLILDHYPFAPTDVDREDAQHNMLPEA
ncbi:uncharacterized protein LOC143019095 [Oratosquilla oratoria]|uniref:uncharacterized protein LOC143019095 n=1 Tax=Oratosquilla oratoria TaxID=337810 RepID=UPI003F76BDC5